MLLEYYYDMFLEPDQVYRNVEHITINLGGQMLSLKYQEMMWRMRKWHVASQIREKRRSIEKRPMSKKDRSRTYREVDQA